MKLNKILSRDMRCILKGLIRITLLALIPYGTGRLVKLNKITWELCGPSDPSASLTGWLGLYHFWNAGFLAWFALVLVVAFISTILLALWFVGGGWEHNR